VAIILEFREVKRLSKRIKSNYYVMSRGESMAIGGSPPLMFSARDFTIVVNPNSEKVLYIGERKAGRKDARI
jgi:hypothetical protein